MCLQYPVRVVRASVWYESLHSTVKRAFWRPFIIKHIATKHSGGDNGSEQSKLLQAPVSLHSREVCKILGWMIFLMLLFLKMSCIKITRSRYFLWHESSKSRVEAVVKIPALEKSVGVLCWFFFRESWSVSVTDIQPLRSTPAATEDKARDSDSLCCTEEKILILI